MNLLAHETSPYLLQHQHNPVDWYPWGEQAIERARREQKPIFLSIGYSACHWCHVMEHESFENEELAQLLNQHFVAIKVDREERPDLDQVYMQAVQAMTGHGGWPMSVFLTPDLKPFFGGTYWPPTSRRGMPGFDQVLRAVAQAWQAQRPQAIEQAEQLTRQLQQLGEQAASAGPLTQQLLQDAATKLERQFDTTHGGFGRAPKFPHAMDLQLLLRVWSRLGRDHALHMVRLTLDKMARGGIYDHLGGGFARYSVDERWLVPHFEKMLYDNALLSQVYLDAYIATGDEDYGRIAGETLDYILRDMTDAQGAFHSTEDADSEGEEGKFYVWARQEIVDLLGPELAERFCYVYDVSEQGNFEGKNILNLPKTLEQAAAIRGWDIETLRQELAAARTQLLQARNRRVRPGKDDKVLVSWNALLIDALARAAGILREPRYLQASRRAADFIFQQLCRDDGRLLHTWRNGQAKLDAYLDDYTYLTGALVSLYEASFEERWIDEAVRLADVLLERFLDPQDGLFYYTAADHEALIARQKDLHDSSVPSGNAMAATALLRLGKLCGRQQYLEAAQRVLESTAAVMQQVPTAMGQMLIAADMFLFPMPQLVMLGELQNSDTAAVTAQVQRQWLPSRVIALRPVSPPAEHSVHLDPLFAGKTLQGPEPALYVCENFACQAPAYGKEAALAALRKLGSS